MNSNWKYFFLIKKSKILYCGINGFRGNKVKSAIQSTDLGDKMYHDDMIPPYQNSAVHFYFNKLT